MSGERSQVAYRIVELRQLAPLAGSTVLVIENILIGVDVE